MRHVKSPIVTPAMPTSPCGGAPEAHWTHSHAADSSLHESSFNSCRTFMTTTEVTTPYLENSPSSCSSVTESARFLTNTLVKRTCCSKNKAAE